VDLKQIMSAIEWRMGSSQQSADAQQIWEEIETWLRDDPERLDAAAARMAEPLIEVIRWGLVPDTDKASQYEKRWIELKKYLEYAGIPGVASFINQGFKKANAGLAGEQDPKDPGVRKDDPTGNSEKALSATDSSKGQTEVLPAAMDTNDQAQEVTSSPEANPAEETTLTPESTAGAASEQPDTSSPSQSSQWRWLPVPNDPDKHDESDQRADFSPEGLKIIGARVRGKKHKHEGTNCDDWFEFGFIGPWTIIAVSDGAGSKVFSRIGAKVSCQTSLKELTNALAEHELKQRDNWSGDTFKRDKTTGVFNADDLEHVQQALHNAMEKAYEAVETKARELADSAVHEEFLGRKVTMDDLSGTLLLAVHTTVMHEGAERSVVFTCQIGDGMLAAVSSNGGLQLLGVPDSGEFAGQTEFLTSKKKVERASLVGRTFPFFGPLEVLMVMTDGVADDYFPNDPGMLWLYGDLAINGVLNLSESQKKLSASQQAKVFEDIRLSLAGTKLPTIDDVEAAGLAVPVETITEEQGSPRVLIRSIATYAEKLGIAPEEVVKSRPLLIAGAFGEPMCDRDARNKEDLLRVWLDSYQVRGSFDDRTLLLLHREVAS
jgi:hypothetical protein